MNKQICKTLFIAIFISVSNTALFSTEMEIKNNPMIIAVGSTNKVKVLAVKESLQESPAFSEAQVVSVSTASDVSAQPLSLSETIQGAMNRAKSAFLQCNSCRYGFGIESGLMESSIVATKFIHISVCCIFDGEQYYTGISTGYEIPPKILALMLNNQIELSQACLDSGISNNEKIGSSEGLIGILTKGKIDRKEYSKQSVKTALLQLENPEWYTQETK